MDENKYTEEMDEVCNEFLNRVIEINNKMDEDSGLVTTKPFGELEIRHAIFSLFASQHLSVDTTQRILEQVSKDIATVSYIER